MTPVGNQRTTGIEINAEAFETMAHGLFITDVSGLWVGLFQLGPDGGDGALLSAIYPVGGRMAAAIIVLAAFVPPYVFFAHQLVFSFATPAPLRG
jgi:hypothetical protein